MGLLTAVGTLAGAVGGLLTRKITETAPDGAQATRRAARPFTRFAGWVLAAVLLYHFLLWPILNFHFPEYGFPPIDAALPAVLAGIGM